MLYFFVIQIIFQILHCNFLCALYVLFTYCLISVPWINVHCINYTLFFLWKIFILSTVLYFLHLLFASYTLFCILQCSIYISEPISNICMNISYLIHNIVHFSLLVFVSFFAFFCSLFTQRCIFHSLFFSFYL